MTTTNGDTLHVLGDGGKTVDGYANDVRGREVTDSEGVKIGKVADLVIDDREEKVRFLVVEHGGFAGFGAKESFIPVDVILKITEDAVQIGHSGQQVASAPGYDPDLVSDRAYLGTIYGHYGQGPFWGPGYMYPGL